MEQWWIAVGVSVMAGMGYLLRRMIEGRRRGETLKRRLQALALFQGMKRTGVTVRDLDGLGEERADCCLACRNGSGRPADASGDSSGESQVSP